MGSVLLATLGACSSSHEKAMHALVTEDRNERKAAIGPSDWEKIKANDAGRRHAVRKQLLEGKIPPSAYCDAATILQRSDESNDLKVAFAFATLCVESDPRSKMAARLQASTWDRYLISMGSQQWYATQFEWLSNGDVRPLPIASHLTSDADRARYGLPSLRKLTSDVQLFNDNRGTAPDGPPPPWAEQVPF